jgi:hypothetical protein
VAAAQSLVAAALASLVCAAAALADAPHVKLSTADQAKAVAALLKTSDLGAGWAGGTIAPGPLAPPSCPGFDPKESDLTVTGHADARFTFAAGGVELDQDVQVLATPADVAKDFRRTISPRLGQCLAYQLARLSKVAGVSVKRVAFPPTGTVSAAYRALVAVRSGEAHGTLLSDYVFFGEGRVEYEFTIIAPVGTGSQLPRFELELAQILLKRAGVVPA